MASHDETHAPHGFDYQICVDIYYACLHSVTEVIIRAHRLPKATFNQHDNACPNCQQVAQANSPEFNEDLYDDVLGGICLSVRNMNLGTTDTNGEAMGGNDGEDQRMRDMPTLERQEGWTTLAIGNDTDGVLGKIEKSERDHLLGGIKIDGTNYLATLQSLCRHGADGASDAADYYIKEMLMGQLGNRAEWLAGCVKKILDGQVDGSHVHEAFASRCFYFTLARTSSAPATLREMLQQSQHTLRFTFFNTPSLNEEDLDPSSSDETDSEA